jgi:hypothetical protein
MVTLTWKRHGTDGVFQHVVVNRQMDRCAVCRYWWTKAALDGIELIGTELGVLLGLGLEESLGVESQSQRLNLSKSKLGHK